MLYEITEREGRKARTLRPRRKYLANGIRDPQRYRNPVSINAGVEVELRKRENIRKDCLNRTRAVCDLH